MFNPKAAYTLQKLGKGGKVLKELESLSESENRLAKDIIIDGWVKSAACRNILGEESYMKQTEDAGQNWYDLFKRSVIQRNKDYAERDVEKHFPCS